MLERFFHRFKSNKLGCSLIFISFFLFFAAVHGASAANNVYYSVGQSTDDLQTGTSSVTISSTTGLATFSSAQTGNMGVGDRLTVSTSTVYYISGKASSTAWYVVTATGTLPQATTTAPVTSIKREFTSLAAAIAAAGNITHASTSDLVATDLVLNLPCYYDSGADTDAADVYGYTTGANNYIKIYTPASIASESNFSQRHQGKWDGEKYNLSVDASYGNSISIDSLHVWLDGLQIDNVANKSEQIKGVRTTNSSADSAQKYSNLIVRASGPGSASGASFGVYLDGSLNYQVWNNLVYGYYEGIVSDTDTNTVSYAVYNNTVVNNVSFGIALNGNATPGLYLKNNLSINNGTDYSTSNLDSSSNNFSSDGTAPGTNSKSTTSVQFVDFANKDFHLDATSSARNAGADLSNDAYLPFNTDIDGNTRSTTSPVSRGWDVGADEGAAAVYYSVGQNTSDHKTGSPNVTVSSTTGLSTFSVAQTAVNMGVGDVVTYGADKCYITAKASTTAWYCATATGTMPVATTSATVTSIAHAFSSLNAALPSGAGGAKGASYLNTSDLIGNNYQLNISCYYDSGPDTNAVNISGWTTGNNNFIKVYTPNNTANEANQSQRHQGKWDNNRYRIDIPTNQANAVKVYEVAKIEGLQIVPQTGGVGYKTGIELLDGSQGSQVLSNIIWNKNPEANDRGIFGNTSITSGNFYVANNLVYDFSATSSKCLQFSDMGTAKAYLSNNTAYACETGYLSDGHNNYVSKNNIAQSCATGFSGADASSNYNISNAGDAPGANSLSSTTVRFIDAANNNFHISPQDNVARNSGLDLSTYNDFAFDNDIDGQSRPTSTPGRSWDIGADQGASIIYVSVGQNMGDLITGSPDMTIASGTVTFTEEQTGNIGVGDLFGYNNHQISSFVNQGGVPNRVRITTADAHGMKDNEQIYIGGAANYGGWYNLKYIDATHFDIVSPYTAESGGAGKDVSNIGFFSGRASTTEWTVVDYWGNTPSDIEDVPVTWIGHGFPTLADAVTDLSGDLVAKNLIVSIPLYFDNDWDWTSVVIDGYTTSEENYINIYTPKGLDEANSIQRHGGLWEGGKYVLAPSLDGVSYEAAIANFEDYVRIDGLQVLMQGDADYISGIVNVFTATSSDIRVSNSIFRGNVSGAGKSEFIGLQHWTTSNSVLKAWNNYFYDIAGGAATEVALWNGNSNGTVYAYNNTVRYCSIGFEMESGNIGDFVVKNNVFLDMFDSAAAGTFSAGTDYNATDDPDFGGSVSVVGGPGGHDRVNQTFYFLDNNNPDSHLYAFDDGARNHGVDLSSDVAIPFGLDIDAQPRGEGGVWDIGADEASRAVYYSVGGTTTDLKTGTTTTVSINNGLATFSTAQVGNIGVGDRVTYGTTSVAYLVGKADASNWYIVTATGTLPSNRATTTLNSINREFTSLATALAGAGDSSHLNSTDLKGVNSILNLPCYYDGVEEYYDIPNDDGIDIEGFNTGADNFVKVYTPNDTSFEANISQRHQGKWDNNKYRILGESYGSLLTANIPYTKIVGLQLERNTDNNPRAISIGDNADYSYVGENIVRLTNEISVGAAHGIEANYGTTGIFLVNNLVYGYRQPGGGDNSCIRIQNNLNFVYNNTVIGCDIGISGLYVGDTFLVNNIVQDSSVGYDTDYGDYTGFSSFSSNNISNDGTAPGTNSKSSTTVSFVDAAAYDFHLVPSDISAHGAGANLSDNIFFGFLTDIDGQPRASVGTWDIGADQMPTAIYRSVGPDATSSLATGASNAVNIADSIATFTQALPDNVGVGDALQYDSDNNGTIDSIAFISGRIDSTHYRIATASGGEATPTSAGDEDWEIYRAYTSLSDANYGDENSGIEASLRDFDAFGGGNNLLAKNQQWNIACYANGTTGDNLGSSLYLGVDWNTGPSNFARAYTPYLPSEVGISQRAFGVWNPNKYYINNVSATQYAALGVVDGWRYSRIDGLQIVKNGSADGTSGIYVAPSMSAGEVHLSNNLIISQSGARFGSGIDMEGQAVSYIYNNIIHKVQGSGIFLQSDGARYVYNNTVSDAADYWGISNYSGTGVTILKNNLVQNTEGDNYSVSAGPFDSSSANNISDDGSSPNSGPTDCAGHGCINQNVSFEDEIMSNLHLKTTDTAARNAGADLSADPDFAFTTDIDGQARTVLGGRSWDVGADQSAYPVYFSVGQNENNHMTGTPTVTISSTTGMVTFSEEQTAPNMGVGDGVSYGSPENWCYISGRASSTVWYCTSATGTAPTAAVNANVNSIEHSFSSLSEALASANNGIYLNTSDLSAANVVLNLPCYYDSGPDTVAVTISGYTTNAQNYINIYTPANTATEANSRQRHHGKWDNAKYVVSSNDNPVINILVNDIRIDGLQVAHTDDVGYPSAIAVQGGAGDARKVWISNSIIKGVGTYTDGQAGAAIWLTDDEPTSLYRIWNNILYDFNNEQDAGVAGIRADTLGSSLVYNNTVYNTRYGIMVRNGWMLAKNNISQPPTSYLYDQGGSFDASSTNNISATAGGWSSPGSNGKDGVIPLFSDERNADFHLSIIDTVAKNAGADLTLDPYLPINSDIDGNPRSQGMAWDAGADESSKVVYYSVGGTTTDLKTGTTTEVSITGGVATFSEPQTGNIGVGDRVAFATTSIAYIAAKIDTSNWRLVTATGTLPSDRATTTLNSIKREFTSLASAFSSASDGNHLNTADLETANMILELPCYDDGAADTAPASLTGFTAGWNNYIRVYSPSDTATEANIGQRHSGKWSDSKYRLSIINNSALEIGVPYTRIEGLQIEVTADDEYENGLYNYATEVRILNNIVRRGGATLRASYGIASNVPDGESAYIYNNIVYGFTEHSQAGFVLDGATNDSVNYVYNNTSVGNANGIQSGRTVVLKNNIVQGIGMDDDYYASGPVDASSTNNISSDGTALGANAKASTTVSFVNPAGNDYHLAADDTAARSAGLDLSSGMPLQFSFDIDGQSRAAGAWDIGADQSTKSIYYSVGQNTNDHKSGTPTVTVSGDTATFSEPQTEANMGIGDIINYGAGAECFITGKASTTVWYCATAIGAPPVATTSAIVNSITHAFASLADAVAGAGDASHLNTTDLVAANAVLNLPCYRDSGPDTSETDLFGWNTSLNNQIRIYTPTDTAAEVNASQRHGGKWDDAKFNLVSMFPLDVDVNYFQIDGLQIKTINTGDWAIPIGNGGQGGGEGENIITISNSILTGSGATGTNAAPMDFYNNKADAYGELRLYNNVMYGVAAPGVDDSGIGANRYTVIAYNNTVISSGGNASYCFRGGLFKNNIAQNCTIAYHTVDPASDYNISDTVAAGAWEAPGSNSKTGTTVSFADAANGDYHLASDDTAAKDAGVDLSADASLAFGADIDGQTRSSALGNWDIGADEGAVVVYYSVGQNVDDHKTGSPTVTVSNPGGMAVFSEEQTATNMGVGDVIDYGAGNRCYISGKASTTVWYCTTATGSAPVTATDATVNSIRHTFTSLNNAFASSSDASHIGTSDLLAANVQLNIPCYYDSGPETTGVDISGYTTGVTNFIRVYVPTDTATEANRSQRHNGKWNEDKYYLDVDGDNNIAVGSSHVRIDGLQIHMHSGAGNPNVIWIRDMDAGGDARVSNNIIRFTDTHDPGYDPEFAGITLFGNNINAKIWNNIVYGAIDDTGAWGSGINLDVYNTAYVYNNTVVGGNVGIKKTYAYMAVLRNNISYGNADNYDVEMTDVTADSNLSGPTQSDAPGTNAKNSVTVVFSDTLNGDFHLAPNDTAAKSAGADLSSDGNLAFDTDIDGQGKTRTRMISDNFNRADGGLGANWTVLHGSPTISGNAVVAPSTSEHVALWNADDFGPDQYSQFTTANAIEDSTLLLRASTSGAFYAADIYDSFFQILKHTGTTYSSGYTQIGTNVAITSGIGDVWTFVAIGTTLELFQNGVSRGTWSDSDISSGQPGFFQYNGGDVIDDWRGGNYVSTWDIGADQSANGVYYSVGQTTDDLKTCAWPDCDTNPLSVNIVNGVAGFSNPQIGNIGVGDRITFSTSSIVYIAGKVNVWDWRVVTVRGDIPPDTAGDVNVNSITREFTSLASAISGASDANHLGTVDIKASNLTLNLAAYYDNGPDTNNDGVGIGGYLTGEANHIKIFTPVDTETEANVRQRHYGKWDDKKYTLAKTTDWSAVLDVESDYVQVIGLQIDARQPNNYGLVLNSGSGRGETSLLASHNIIRNSSGAPAESYSRAISVSSFQSSNIVNNIVYDSSWGISTSDYDAYSKFVVANNTIVNCDKAFDLGANPANSDTYLYNNIAQNSATSDYELDIVTSQNNISADNTSPDDAFDGKAVAFVSTSTSDFHLLPTDTVAKNLGLDLSDNGSYAFNDDIDGQTRSSAWDIGADEAATAVYYSVGQNTSDHKTGSPTVTVSSSTGLAIFSVEQGASNMGVGDVITYATTSKCYITAKASTTAWYCATATGTTPIAATNAIVNSIAHAFDSLAAASATSTNNSHLGTGDLMAANIILNIPCYYDSGADAVDGIVFNNQYKTSPNNYIRVYTPVSDAVETNLSQRHQGVWNDKKYHIANAPCTGDWCGIIGVDTGYIRIEGLQLDFNDGGQTTQHLVAIGINPGVNVENEARISGNILRSTGPDGGHGIGIGGGWDNGVSHLKVWNNIIYDFGQAGISNANNGNAVIYNNTIYNSNSGIESDALIKNNISFNNADADYQGAPWVWSSSTNNVSSDSTADDGEFKNGLVDKVAADEFVDVANRDFHLKPGSSLRGAGADLSADEYLAFGNDIDGQVRAVPWDIGADEGATAVYYSVGQNTSDHKTGSPTATIASGTVTFSEEQDAPNMGVGDVIDYGLGNKCYISGKASTTVWYCTTATGTMPANVTDETVNSISHAYDSLAGAIGGAGDDDHLNTFDLATANVILNIPAYYDNGPDTSGVIIDGYDTSASNYIKIYTPSDTATEVNYSQRHQGKWDDGKYRLKNDISGYPADAITVNEDHVRIEGLQLEFGSDAYSFSTGIKIDNVSNGSDGVVISSNIIKGNEAAIYKDAAIYVYSGSSNGFSPYIFNNIIYGCGEGFFDESYSADGIDGVTYLYNNTIYDTTDNGVYTRGIGGGGRKILAKNNLVQSAAVGYSGDFDASSTNNISQDATSPNSGGTDCGGHSCRNQTIQFADSANKNFHLASGDIAAKNSGADLSADSDFAFNTDIDGSMRRSGSWSIGADEGANAVYYSIGQSTADLQTGTSTVTISSSTGLATFSIAQTGNIGVGDRLTVATNTVYYISGKASTSAWYVVTATGTLPVVTTSAPVTSIKREYTSLSVAVAGASNSSHLGTADLIAANIQLNFPAYYDNGPDTSGVVVSGYVTGASNNIRIYTPNSAVTETNRSQRHVGKATGLNYVINPDDYSAGITIFSDHTVVDGLEVTGWGEPGYSAAGIQIEYLASNVLVKNNLVHDDGDTSDYAPIGISFGYSYYGGNNTIVNNIVYSVKGNGSGIHVDSYGAAEHVYNNTVYGMGNGCFMINGPHVLKNNICQNAAGPDYDVAGIIGANNNISSDGTAPGANSLTTTTVQFADTTNKDFHLAASSTARNAGADLDSDSGLSFGNDIDGNNRSGLWDVGADEGATAVYYSVGQNTNDHKVGSPTVTISSTTGLAIFSVAQTAINMGVGDVITYGSDKCYITAKASTTAWYCVTATGTMPVATTSATVTSVAHAFTSLNQAIGNGTNQSGNSAHLNTSDLVNGNFQLNIPCYYDSGPETTNLTMATAYTTGPANYIKVYTPNSSATEANKSQRHQGVWDDGLYNITVNAGMSFHKSYTVIDGLQFNIGSVGVYFYGETEGSRISNSIIKSTFGADYGVRVDGAGTGTSSVTYVNNNIVYGMSQGIVRYYDGGNKILYAYNNTVYGASSSGIYDMAGSKLIAKNNVVQNSVIDYKGTFNAASDYNIASVGAVPGAHSLATTTVQFADILNKDFHLAASSSARNIGTDLSADPVYAFSVDIDGHARPSLANPAWDIGADEGATAVYYSVGQNTTDHKTGSPNVTISSTTGLATFDVAQTATNMGVGDVITYGGSNKCYITGKASTTAWYCTTATGTAPIAASGATVNSIAHAFSSLSSAVVNATTTSYLATTSLVGNNHQLNLPCYYDSGPDTAGIKVGGYETALPNFIKIYTPASTTSEVNQSQRHQGVWDDSKYQIRWDSGYVSSLLQINNPNTHVEGLQLRDNQTTWNSYPLQATGVMDGGFVKIIGNIVRGNPQNQNSSYGIYDNTNEFSPARIFIINNIVYDNRVYGIFSLSYRSGVTVPGIAVLANNTVYGTLGVGIRFQRSADGRFAVAKNNLVVGSGSVNYDSAAPDVASNNMSSDNTMFGSGYLNASVAFADSVNKDFHLSASSSARNKGADLSSDQYFSFNTDIDLQSRNLATNVWDIGADEAANAVYYSVGQSTADLKTGSPTVTIASGMATFSVAQTGNIGVGDRVTYNSSSSVAYISGKASTTVWYVLTATGTMPADITNSAVDSIKREYTSLSAAVTGASNASHMNTADMYTANLQLNLPAYYDSGADTANVMVNGYTSAAANYIKIYTPNNTATEANVTQRHDGKWSDNKYSLSSGVDSLTVRVSYSVVDGLQVFAPTGIYLYTPAQFSTIKNNIVKNNGTGSWHYGIRSYLSTGDKVFNNIVYGFNDVSNYAIGAGGYGPKSYYYNNTALDSTYCYFVDNSPSAAVLSNNIAQNCGDGYWKGDASSNYNLSDLASDAPGANSKNGVKVEFVDAANKDFHLKLSDKYARDMGANLSADANYAFNTDIDGQARGKGLGWDIGADETGTQIYYSVGQNTNDHKTGSPTVTVSGSTATFSVAQTATNMGVGDVVTYGTDKCYIAGKISQTAWSCLSANGSLPIATSSATVSSIAHAFVGLGGAFSFGGTGAKDASHLNTADLVSGNYQLNIPCYRDSGPDSTSFDLTDSGYILGKNNYLRIYTPVDTITEVNASQRHQGKWDDSKYVRLGIFKVGYSYMRVEGLQVDAVDDRGIFSNSPYSGRGQVIADNIVRGRAQTAARRGIWWTGTASDVSLRNNVIYGFSYAGSYGVYLEQAAAESTPTVYNNTVYGNATGIALDADAYYSNNLSYNNGVDYSGTAKAGSTNNLSKDATANGINPQINKVVIFVDASSSDFHISNNDNSARDAGVGLTDDPYLPFMTDIDGQIRPVGGVWDIGADEAAGSTRIRGGVKIDGAVKINKY